MATVRFGAEDLARTRLRATAWPAGETVFALGLLHRRGGAAFAPWRAEASRKLCGLAATNPIAARLRALRLPDDLLGLLTGTAVPGLSDAQAEAAVLDLWRVLLAPYWQRVQHHLAADREHRGRIMAAGGVDALLSSLDRRVRWRPPVLEVDGPGGEIPLGGCGLLLWPSTFVGPPRLLCLAGRPTLVYPAPIDQAVAATLWSGTDAGRRALGDLVGRTRADTLRALTDSCGTTELADRLGISSAGASQHAAVLRRSGLITTSRTRNTVLHTVTPLGRALLCGRLGDG